MWVGVIEAVASLGVGLLILAVGFLMARRIVYNDVPPPMGFPYTRWARRHFARQFPTARFGPVTVQYFGDRAGNHFLTPVVGALGVLPGAAVFVRDRFRQEIIRLPLHELRGVNRVLKYLYRETPQGDWQVHHFDDWGDWADFVNALHTIGDVPIYDSYDLGPVNATMMQQDMLGVWQTMYTGPLHLAPDRVLFRGRTAAEFTSLRGIAVLDLPHEALLRLDVAEPDQPRRVIGFRLPDDAALQFSRELGKRTRIQVQWPSGRKKKGVRQ